MARLSVNLNKVALLRNARHTGVPDLLTFARIVVDAGAKGITIHPRPDERHIRESDVPLIGEWMQPLRPTIEFNIEGYPDDRFLKIVAAAEPEQCTLVPDSPSAFTSEKGWVLDEAEARLLRPKIASLKKSGGRIILFVDQDFSAARAAKELGADGIEIYTGSYAEAFRTGAFEPILATIAATAASATAAGLVVNIGHDLNLQNILPLIRKIPFIAEASIGHELTADALEIGFAEAVRSYAAALSIPGEQYHAVDSLNEKNADRNPFKQFDRWYRDATKFSNSNAMILATSTKKGVPSGRVVLLKHHDARRGFTFYTNYQSRKSRELMENPHAALVFHWRELERQVRITGKVAKTSKKESLEYFRTRPRESQLGAWASLQSSTLPDRAALEKRMEIVRKQYEGKDVPLPPHWGGFRLVPVEFEFWHQAHAGRLHDRISYKKSAGGTWRVSRFSP